MSLQIVIDSLKSSGYITDLPTLQELYSKCIISAVFSYGSCDQQLEIVAQSASQGTTEYKEMIKKLFCEVAPNEIFFCKNSTLAPITTSETAHQVTEAAVFASVSASQSIATSTKSFFNDKLLIFFIILFITLLLVLSIIFAVFFFFCHKKKIGKRTNVMFSSTKSELKPSPVPEKQKSKDEQIRTAAEKITTEEGVPVKARTPKEKSVGTMSATQFDETKTKSQKTMNEMTYKTDETAKTPRDKNFDTLKTKDDKTAEMQNNTETFLSSQNLYSSRFNN